MRLCKPPKALSTAKSPTKRRNSGVRLLAEFDWRYPPIVNHKCGATPDSCRVSGCGSCLSQTSRPQTTCSSSIRPTMRLCLQICSGLKPYIDRNKDKGLNQFPVARTELSIAVQPHRVPASASAMASPPQISSTVVRIINSQIRAS